MSLIRQIDILHLISSAGLLGAERVLLELAILSKEAGLRVAVGVFENSRNPNLELAEAARKHGLEIKIFPCTGRFDKNTVQMIKDYVDGKGVQILHSHNYKSNFYARKALSENEVRWVVTNHGRRFGAKLLAYNLLDTFIVRHADKLVAVSEEIAGKMKLARIGPERICVIENGVNWGRFNGNEPANSTRESLGIEKEAPIIGAVGSLTKEKGHVYLLKAVPEVIEKFPNAVFLIVGDGSRRAALEEIATELGIRNNVTFLGMRKDIREILSFLDVFVLPSLNEGLPMALLEAQAARVPAVATSVGAIPKVIQDGVTGILLPPKNPKLISQAICQILSDRNFACKMAKKAFERVRDNFSSEKMAGEYLSVYGELLS